MNQQSGQQQYIPKKPGKKGNKNKQQYDEGEQGQYQGHSQNNSYKGNSNKSYKQKPNYQQGQEYYQPKEQQQQFVPKQSQGYQQQNFQGGQDNYQAINEPQQQSTFQPTGNRSGGQYNKNPKQDNSNWRNNSQKQQFNNQIINQGVDPEDVKTFEEIQRQNQHYYQPGPQFSSQSSTSTEDSQQQNHHHKNNKNKQHQKHNRNSRNQGNRQSNRQFEETVRHINNNQHQDNQQSQQLQQQLQGMIGMGSGSNMQQQQHSAQQQFPSLGTNNSSSNQQPVKQELTPEQIEELEFAYDPELQKELDEQFEFIKTVTFDSDYVKERMPKANRIEEIKSEFDIPAMMNNKEKREFMRKQAELKRQQTPVHPIIKEVRDIFNSLYAQNHASFLRFCYRDVKQAFSNINDALEDPNETFQMVETISRHFEQIKGLTTFQGIMVHVGLEFEAFGPVSKIIYKNTKLLENKLFGKTIEKIEKRMKQKTVYMPNYSPTKKPKINPNFDGCLDLNDLERDERNVIVLERIQKLNNKAVKVGELEKIKQADMISIHFERNQYKRDYLALVTVATREDIFILDMERLCQFPDNLVNLMDFFNIALSKRSTTVIMLDPENFIQLMMKTLFIDKEKENKEFYQNKLQLLATFTRFKSHYVNMEALGYQSTNEMANFMMKMKLDKRQLYSDWYWRPLTTEQIKFAAIEVALMFKTYEKLMANVGNSKKDDDKIRMINSEQ